MNSNANNLDEADNGTSPDPYYPDGDDVVNEDAAEIPDEDAAQADDGLEDQPEEAKPETPAPSPKRKRNGGRKTKDQRTRPAAPQRPIDLVEISKRAQAAMAFTQAEHQAAESAERQARASDEARRAADSRRRAQEQALQIAAMQKAVQAEPKPDDLPSREAIAGAVLLVRPELHDRLVEFQRQDTEALARNAIVSLQGCDTALLDTAAESGRLVLLVLPQLTQSFRASAPQDMMPNSLLAWHAKTNIKVGVIQDRHAVWVQREIRRRLALHEVFCPTFKSLITFESESDQEMWRSGDGIARWLSWGHITWISAEGSRVVHETRVAEQAEQLVEQRREFNRRIRTKPAFASPFEVLHINRGGVTFFLDGLLVDESMAALIGPPENGKSKVTCALAVAAAAGKPFCGRRINGGEACRVLYIARERLVVVAADISANCENESDRQLVAKNLSLTSFVPKLDGSSGMTLEQWAVEIRAADAKLIIVDTYTATLAANGVDEITGAGPVLEAFRDIIAVTGAVVLFNGHARKSGDGDERGQALREAADCMLPVAKEREGDGELVVRLGLAGKHAKHSCHARPTLDLLLTFRAEQEGGLRLHDYAEVVPLSTDSPRKAHGQTKPSAADKALAVLTKEPQGFKAIREASGVPPSTLSTTLAKLIGKGLVVAEERAEGKVWKLT